MWTCPRLEYNEHKEVKDSNCMKGKSIEVFCLKAERRREWKEQPLETIWLRGLIPKKAWHLPMPNGSYDLAEGSHVDMKLYGKVCTD